MRVGKLLRSLKRLPNVLALRPWCCGNSIPKLEFLNAEKMANNTSAKLNRVKLRL